MSIIPNNKKLKILMDADDPRLFSGVGIMTDSISRVFVENGWDVVHIASAIKHPNFNVIVDDIGRKIYPYNGYGDIFFLRNIIEQEKPDIMWIMTDPRYWTWLFAMEDEVRSKMPLIWYSVWDALPPPKYNFDYYNSCDYIHCISKLSYNIVKQCAEETNSTYKFEYCPHGIDIDLFKPLKWKDKFDDLIELQRWEFEGRKGDKPSQINLYQFADRVQEAAIPWRKDYKNVNFIVFWNNKNMRRKNAPLIMEGFHKFAKDKDDCILLLHTDPVTEHGTDLPVVRETLFSDVPIIIFPQKIPPEEMVKFYNISACVVNVASAEGFGLSNLEAMSCGTPTIICKTGGLQDQIYYKGDKKYPCGIEIPIDAQVMVGSPPTPYIYDDYISPNSLANALEEMYLAFKKRRSGSRYDRWCKNSRKNAIENFDANKMCQQHVDSIKWLVENWEPRKKWIMEKL